MDLKDKVIKFKRGLKSNLPQFGIEGQPYFTTDTNELYIGRGEKTPLSKIAKQEKIITFVFIDGKDGPIGPSIKFPYKGIVKDIDANCGHLGNKDTIIAIEKISKQNYINDIDKWGNILEKNITIPKNKKMNLDDFKIKEFNVNKDDYFRINVKEYGNIRDIVIQLSIEIMDI